MVGGTLRVWAPGKVSLAGGKLVAAALNIAEGEFNMTGGRLSASTVTGNLTIAGGALAPGESPGLTTINGDYTQQASGKLEIEIGGWQPGAGHDQLNVTGQLSLAGTMSVSLINNYVPRSGQSFNLLDWGTRTYATPVLELPVPPAGLQWSTARFESAGELSIVRRGTIAQWTFETTGPSISGTGSSFGPIAAEEGSGVARGGHASAETAWSAPAGNGSTDSFSANNWAPNDYFEFQTSTTGHSDISVEFSHTSSNFGPKEWGIFYSTTGTGEFIDTGITYSVLPNASSAATWSFNPDNFLPSHFYTFDLSHIAALDDQATLVLRLVNISTLAANDGIVSPDGTSRVDTVTIFDAVSLPGDYNDDGTVNAADYTVWRNNFGSGTSLANDDTPGVGQDDYKRWKKHFGETAGNASDTNANTPIPEPTTLMMLPIAAAGALTRRRCRT